MTIELELMKKRSDADGGRFGGPDGGKSRGTCEKCDPPSLCETISAAICEERAGGAGRKQLFEHIRHLFWSSSVCRGLSNGNYWWSMAREKVLDEFGFSCISEEQGPWRCLFAQGPAQFLQARQIF